LSMQELRKLAKEYKLAAGGTKAELKDRIDLYIEEQKPKKGQTIGWKGDISGEGFPAGQSGNKILLCVGGCGSQSSPA